ncbi:MAG: hypothetical protein JO053_02630 [Acidobacteria bacterium]|nr:hypothetical protein [Acidobacteriota bacterium]
MLGQSSQNLNNAVISNRLEALRVLADSLISEINGLSRNIGKEDDNGIDLAQEVQQFEISLIRSALVRTAGRQRKAAALLGIKPTTLHEKMKRYGMLNQLDENGGFAESPKDQGLVG